MKTISLVFAALRRYVGATWTVWAFMLVTGSATIAVAVAGVQAARIAADQRSGCVTADMTVPQRAAQRGVSVADYQVLFAYLPIDSVEYCRLDAPMLADAVTAAYAKQQAARAEGAGGLWLRFEAAFESVVESFAGGETAAQRAAEGEGRGGEAIPPDPEYFRMRYRDENGNIPADGNSIARAHIASMRAADSARAAGINKTSWTSLGPGNIGGRVRALVIHPTNTSIIYTAGVAGGVWKTTNAGASWRPLDDFMANMAVTSLAIDPIDPRIIYAATGEGNYNGDASQGNGVFVSRDDGKTWSQYAATANSSFSYQSKILAIKRSGKTQIVVATRSGVATSKDNGKTWIWGKLTSGAAFNPGSSGLYDLEVSPSDPMRMLAAGDGKIWLSTDGGMKWKTVAGIPLSGGASELAWSVSQPLTVYASLDMNSGSIYKSTDGGAKFVSVSNPKHLGSQGWYGNTLWVDPTDPNALLMGGVDLFRSTNGGKSVTRVAFWQYAPLSPHADQHIIVADPKFNGGTNKKVYVGNDGGVYRTSNYRTATDHSGWTELNNKLGITQYFSVRGDASGGHIIGGTQDNGNIVGNLTSSEDWFDTTGGDGGEVELDTSDPSIMYTEYVMLSYLSRCSWSKWDCTDITGAKDDGTWKDTQYVIDDVKTGSALFIAPIAIDPNNTNTLLAGGDSLWRTQNAKAAVTSTTGPTWEAIKPSLGVGEYGYIATITVAKNDADQIWVGTPYGGVYKTANGTAAAASVTWTSYDAALPNRFVADIEVDPTNTQTVYVTFGGYAADNVWKSTDGGTTWAAATGTGVTALPSIPVWSIAIHPGNANWLYAGTELGIFTSEDGGATWQVTTDGPANAPIYDLSWMGEKLLAATHGRGIFSTMTNNP